MRIYLLVDNIGLSDNHSVLCADGIAGSITIGIINYVLLGFQLPVDGYFMHAFEIWLATTVVFWGSGTIGYTLLEYRLGRKSLVSTAVFVPASFDSVVHDDPTLSSSSRVEQYPVHLVIVSNSLPPSFLTYSSFFAARRIVGELDVDTVLVRV